MPNQTNNEKEMLRELEKLTKKIIRKALKNNTLDYTVQFTISSLAPGKVQYAAQISSPTNGVQPITFVFDKFEELKNVLIASETDIALKDVEVAFHQNRINMYEDKVIAHKERLVQIENGQFEVDDEDIAMEEV